jgi:hypothetical protein
VCACVYVCACMCVCVLLCLDVRVLAYVGLIFLLS